jgi:hypothetical protein
MYAGAIAGSLAGLIVVLRTVSYVAFIFTGSISQFGSQGNK